MALSVVYGNPPYDRPFRLPQLSGGFYGDHLVYVGPGQATDGTNTYSFGGTWGGSWLDLRELLQWVPQGQLSWVGIGAGPSFPSGSNLVVVGGSGIYVFAEAVSSSFDSVGSIQLCAVGLDQLGRIVQFVDKRSFPQPGNKLDWWP